MGSKTQREGRKGQAAGRAKHNNGKLEGKNWGVTKVSSGSNPDRREKGKQTKIVSHKNRIRSLERLLARVRLLKNSFPANGILDLIGFSSVSVVELVNTLAYIGVRPEGKILCLPTVLSLRVAYFGPCLSYNS
jgi:hypothetical protein